MREYIKNYIEESIDTKTQILSSNMLNLIENIASLIIKSYQNNKKVLIAGNGGSAADAQHIATELVSKFNQDRPALNAIALTTNTSIITAVANDFDYKEVFSRQIQAYGEKEDIFIAISTSGNSENIILAIKEARTKGLKTIGLTGSNNGVIDDICDYIIKVPSNKTPIIQESHIMIGHILCSLIEKNLF